MSKTKCAICSVCRDSNSIYYISTNALMHKDNQEHYIFNKCLSCDSVFLTNPVEQEQLHDYYTDNYLPYKGARAWGKHHGFVTKSQEKLDLKKVQFLKSCLIKDRPFTLLDVGCGDPSFLNLAQKKLSAVVTGIDFSDNGWKNQPYENIALHKIALSEFEPNSTFDIITLWHYLEHDYNLQATAEKLYNCLNPGGKLIIEVPDYTSFMAKKQKQFWQGWHSPRHLTLFSEKGIQFLFDTEKWKISKYLKYGTMDAFTLWWLGKMEQKKINWSLSMEKEFWPLVFSKVVRFPFFLLEKKIPMGIQLIVIEKK